MRPIKQTIFGFPRGNCLAACVASILEVELDTVPNFVDGIEDSDKVWTFVKAWLHEHFQLHVLTLGFNHYDTFANTYFDNPGRLCLVSGPSPRIRGAGHVCVGRVTPAGGIKIEHDPHPDDTGLPEGYRWIRFLVGAGT